MASRPAKGKPVQSLAVTKRPIPPRDLQAFIPAEGVAEWVQENILASDGAIHNPEHAHLIEGDIAFMWAPGGFEKQMRKVLGQCEQVMIREGGWKGARQEQQFNDWFGDVPSFLITLDAHYCQDCPDVDWCALIEHELYHIAHAVDEFGAPKFSKDGMPKLKMRGHDVEEFTGVVRRYGASQDVQALVDAARQSPEVGHFSIAHACGTCMQKAA